MERKVWTAAAGLAACATLAPLGVAALTGTWLGPPRLALALGATLVGPGAAAILVGTRGLWTLASDPALRRSEEPEQAILRVFLAAALLAYLGAIEAAGIAGVRLHALEALAVMASPAAWLILVHVLVQPGATLRRTLAPALDALFLGLFLHWGGTVAVPWAALYLVLAFDQGLRFGPRALARSALINALSAAAMVLTTPVWRTMPLADATLLAAFCLLAPYGALLARRAHRARTAIAAQADEPIRRAAFLHHELGIPVAAIGAAAGSLALRTLDEDEPDALTTLGVAGRTLAALLDALLLPGATKRSENFVLRETIADAVLMLRAEAQAKEIALNLAVDPRLPYRCRGPAVRFGELVMNLVAAALAAAADGEVSVAAKPGERSGGGIALQLAVLHHGTRIDQAPAYPRAVAAALSADLGGVLRFDDAPAAASLELALDTDGDAWTPELDGARVVLGSADRALGERLASLVASWGGELRARDDFDEAIEPGTVVVLDARTDALGALALAHRLAGAPTAPTLVLIAGPAAGAAIAAIAAGDIAALIEEPLQDAAFADALSIARAAATPSRRKAPGLTLLLAAAQAQSLKLALERAGHRVVLAEDGGAALAAMDKGGFDGAFIELDLPTMGGEALAKLGRLRHPGEGLPLVALAADLSAATEARCREAGFDAVAARNATPAALLGGLERARAARRSRGTVLAPDVAHIASHPRYLGDAAEVVHEATLDSLRGLGGAEFVADVVESFRHDAQRIVASLRLAAEGGELRAFAEAAHALHSGAANVGGVRLGQTLTALEDLTEAELRQAGAAFVEKIESELARLDIALEPFSRKERHG